MKRIIQLSLCLPFLLMFATMIFWGQGCTSTDPIPCKVHKDCPALHSCVSRICKKQCVSDKDCESLGKTCVGGHCGGGETENSGDGSDTKDNTPDGECTPGTSQECYTAEDATTAGVGLCQKGKQSCGDDKKWGECKGEVTPLPEQCNGKDDNCNGQTDEDCGLSCAEGQTKPCYTAPDNTKNVGRCKPGTQTCEKLSDGTFGWGQCEGQSVPIPELCSNNIDDDCNGKVNDNCECKTGDTQPCKADNGCAGLRACEVKGSTSKWGICNASKASEEVCDGLDNDCDGKVDNTKGDSKKLVRECKKICFKGTQECTSSKAGEEKWSECTAKDISEEKCNGIDDDCDGKVDNLKHKNLPMVQGCKHPTAKGICAISSQQKCVNAKWDICTAGTPLTETCNGQDDDCDGKTDEIEDLPCGKDQQGNPIKCGKDTLGNVKCL